MNTVSLSYRRHRFPPEIISQAVWRYHRFALSLPAAEDLLAERGISVSREAIRLWCAKFGPDYAPRLRQRQGRHYRLRATTYRLLRARSMMAWQEATAP